MIKVWDYKKEYELLRDDILDAVDSVFKSGTLIFGPNVDEFEKKFSSYHDTKFGIGVGNCTDAITISLKALGVTSNDEVITTSNTAVPTVTGIVNTGASVRFVDINDYSLIDVNKIEKAINEKTKAIIPVHLYGQMCEMDKIMELANKYNLKVIEDCAQSHGATYKGKKAGSIGDVGCFSFYPTKIFGAYGDGGFILTNDKNSYKKIKRLRFYGIETVERNKFKNKYYANVNGYNSRLDEVQASILNFKLKKTDGFINKRRSLAKYYCKNLNSANITLPKENFNCKHVYHLFTIHHPKGDLLTKKLYKHKIQTRKIYPYPIHKMKAYSKIIKNKSSLKNSEKKSKGIICLPLYPELAKREILKVCNVLKKIIKTI